MDEVLIVDLIMTHSMSHIRHPMGFSIECQGCLVLIQTLDTTVLLLIVFLKTLRHGESLVRNYEQNEEAGS